MSAARPQGRNPHQHHDPDPDENPPLMQFLFVAGCIGSVCLVLVIGGLIWQVVSLL